MSFAAKRKIPKIQIAGLKTVEEIDLCAKAGADGFGFLLMLDYPRGDALDLETVKALSTHVKTIPNGCSVLISHTHDPETIIRTALETGISAFQVHNNSDHEMPEEDLKKIKTGLGATTFIKVFHIPKSGPVTEELRKKIRMLAQIADALIFDTKATETIEGQNYETLGGTGQINNWDIAKELVALVSPTPVIYAGGLDPDNVAEAIRYIQPYGVDVNSGTRVRGGVEKDPEKIHAFVRNAAAAFDTLGT